MTVVQPATILVLPGPINTSVQFDTSVQFESWHDGLSMNLLLDQSIDTCNQLMTS